jgi:hypothetical protein
LVLVIEKGFLDFGGYCWFSQLLLNELAGTTLLTLDVIRCFCVLGFRSVLWRPASNRLVKRQRSSLH